VSCRGEGWRLVGDGGALSCNRSLGRQGKEDEEWEPLACAEMEL